MTTATHDTWTEGAPSSGKHMDMRGNGGGVRTAEQESGGMNAEGLARALGFFSIGLGLAQILSPRGVARTIGLPRRRCSA